MTAGNEEFIERYDFTDGQREAFNTLASGSNVFLTGEAGTGKSYVLNAFLDWCEEEHLNVLPMAPTGIAALNLRGGSTIHRTLSIKAGFLDPRNAPSQPRKVLRNADVIVIDEISMCRIDLFEYVVSMILTAQRVSGRKQIVLVGDFFQLPPVVTNDDRPFLASLYGSYWKKSGHENWDGFCFDSQYWKGLNLVPCVLHQIVRQQDADFQSALNELRTGDDSCMSFFNRLAIESRAKANKNSIWLCMKNSAADKINQERLAEIENEVEYTYDAESTGRLTKSDKAAPEVLKLKKGARVMSLANGDGYQNGSLGTVVECRRTGGVDVVFDATGEIVTIQEKRWSVLKAEGATRTEDDPYTGEPCEKRYVKNVEVGSYTQIPLRLAYAVTVHKSQGQTFDGVLAETHAFAPGQLYVALSRCRSAEGLQVYPKVESRYIRANRLVVEFYKHLEEEIEARRKQALVEAAGADPSHATCSVLAAEYPADGGKLPTSVLVASQDGSASALYAPVSTPDDRAGERAHVDGRDVVVLPEGVTFSSTLPFVKRTCPVCGGEILVRAWAFDPKFCPCCGTRFTVSLNKSA